MMNRSIGLVLATVALATVSALPAAATPSKRADQAVTLLNGVCLPAARQGRSFARLELPRGYEPVEPRTAAAFLGGEDGDVYAADNPQEPVVAIWTDGRCAVYLRLVRDPQAEAGALAAWAAGLGLATVGEPVRETSDAGADTVTQTFAGDAAAPTVLITHHQRPGKSGGATVSVLPPVPGQASGS